MLSLREEKHPEIKLDFSDTQISQEKMKPGLDLKTEDSSPKEEKYSPRHEMNIDGLSSREQRLSTVGLTEFQAGDILLYLPTKKSVPFTQKIISLFQCFTKRKNGHYEITHAAIFAGYYEEEGKLVPKIVDVTGAGYSVRRMKEDQPLLVFRPDNQEIGKLIADAARSVRSLPKKPYWSCCVGLCTLFKRKQLDPKRNLALIEKKEIPNATICSQFVIKTVKKALMESKLPERIQRDYYLNITSTSTPKDLEAELYENENYRMLCYIGKENPFALIKKEVEVQLERLRQQTDKAAKEKFRLAASRFDRIINQELRTDKYDNLQKAIILTKLMLDPFSINTGWGLKTATSYTNLLNFARGIGIFRRDINNFEYRKPNEIEMHQYVRLEEMSVR